MGQQRRWWLCSLAKDKNELWLLMIVCTLFPVPDHETLPFKSHITNSTAQLLVGHCQDCASSSPAIWYNLTAKLNKKSMKRRMQLHCHLSESPQIEIALIFTMKYIEVHWDLSKSLISIKVTKTIHVNFSKAWNVYTYGIMCQSRLYPQEEVRTNQPHLAILLEQSLAKITNSTWL